MQFVRAQSQRSLDATMCHSASMRVMCVVFRFTDEWMRALLHCQYAVSMLIFINSSRNTSDGWL